MSTKMKYGLCVLLLAGIIGCDRKDAGKTFEITGKITNNNASMVFLDEITSTQSTVVDSAKINSDGSFTLGAGSEESVMYNLRINSRNEPVAIVINDVPSVTLEIELNDNKPFAEKFNVKGSPASQAMKDFVLNLSKSLDEYYKKRMELNGLKGNFSDSLVQAKNKEVADLSGGMNQYAIDAIKKANDPALIIFQLGYFQSIAMNYGVESIPLEQESALVNEASAKFPSHGGIRFVKKAVDEKMEERLIGRTAPDFTLPDVNGKDVSLSSLRGKYVLVDFWASWCKPCRDENPNVVAAYNKYRDKNFTILGVSLDRPGQKDKWIEAIRADNLTWQHVSDLKFWESEVVPLYKIRGIPFNVLLDPEGKIIASGLHGSGLHETLEKEIR